MKHHITPEERTQWTSHLTEKGKHLPIPVRRYSDADASIPTVHKHFQLEPESTFTAMGVPSNAGFRYGMDRDTYPGSGVVLTVRADPSTNSAQVSSRAFALYHAPMGNGLAAGAWHSLIGASGNNFSGWEWLWSNSLMLFNNTGQGHIRFPNGLCIQWGSLNVPAGAMLTRVTFPLAMTSLLSFTLTGNAHHNATNAFSEPSSYSGIGVSIRHDQPQTTGIGWLAIGFIAS